jgi:Asp/Glu/hydantoin racemase
VSGMSRRILLINPNSSMATTDMMVAIAQAAAGDAYEVVGATASRSPPMITEPEALAASAPQVVEIALARAADCAGIVVSAFGDPGLAQVQARSSRPAAGICESSVREAAAGGRSFAIVTTTPALAEAINGLVAATGLGALYTGMRLTQGDPMALAADADAVRIALGSLVSTCVEKDKAEAVIIGSGPLARVASQLRPLFGVPIIEPIPAATRRVIASIEGRR